MWKNFWFYCQLVLQEHHEAWRSHRFYFVLVLCREALIKSLSKVSSNFGCSNFFIFSYSVDFECEGKAPFCAVWMWHRKIAFYKKTENFWTFTKTDGVNMIMETEAHLYDFSRYLRKRQSETNLITTLRGRQNCEPIACFHCRIWQIKSRIQDIKENEYWNSLAKIQIFAMFLAGDIWRIVVLKCIKLFMETLCLCLSEGK